VPNHLSRYDFITITFQFFGSSTWTHILVYTMYDLSSTNAIFDGVSIHDLLGPFPLPLLGDFSADDSQHTIVELYLL
jgi:hypothetical protein